MVDGEPVVFAVVAFDGQERARVAQVLMVFESPAAADRYANAAGIADFVVGPVGFTELPAAAERQWPGWRVP